MILVTGGAGFIGSHIVDALVAAGPRGARRRRAAAHGACRPRPTTSTPARAMSPATCAIPTSSPRALHGVDAVCHQAAMVGLGVDLADIDDYVRPQRSRHRRAAAGRCAAPRFSGRLVLASSMVVYGEGAYALPASTARCAPPRAIRPRWPPATSSRLPGCAAARSTRSRSPRTRRSTRATSTRPPRPTRSTCASPSRVRPAYGHRAALPQRVRARACPATPPTPESPRSSPAPSPRGRRPASSRTAASGATSSTSAMSPAPTSSRSPRAAVRPARSTWPAATRARSARWPMHSPTRPVAGAPRPRVTGAFRVGDVRHVFASAQRAAAVLGFAASEDFRAGMAEFARAPLRTT